jgi:hypothetical protein
MTAPHPMPTLDALADHLELALQLPRELAFRLYLKARAVADACVVAVFTEGAPAHDDDLEHDELIDAKEAARTLHRSVSWVQQHARTAPLKFCLVQSLGRGLLFSRRKINRLIAHEIGQNPTTQALGLRGVNAGRRPRRKGSADPPSVETPHGESREE